jgi:hypothetical protein
MRRLIARLAMAAAMAAAIGGFAGCSGCGDGGSDAPAPPPKDKYDIPLLFRFESFTSAQLVGGGRVDMASYEGRVVLLDLFSTESPDARRYAPLLVSMYFRFHKQGFDILGLAYDITSGPEQAAMAVEAYREEFQAPYGLALGPESVWEELRRRAGAHIGMPALVLIDRQGIVREVFEGLPPGREALLADRIERLLAESVSVRPTASGE